GSRGQRDIHSTRTARPDGKRDQRDPAQPTHRVQRQLPRVLSVKEPYTMQGAQKGKVKQRSPEPQNVSHPNPLHPTLSLQRLRYTNTTQTNTARRRPPPYSPPYGDRGFPAENPNYRPGCRPRETDISPTPAWPPGNQQHPDSAPWIPHTSHCHSGNADN